MSIALTHTEENYLKAIYHLSVDGTGSVSTTSLSASMETKPATVSDMMRKLSDKRVIHYEKYKGVKISELGKTLALEVIRKHRLWEVFLVEKLQFNWDEVHEIAEQLEHIASPLLVEKLDAYLGHPKVDPHGDPIPDKHGKFKVGSNMRLSEIAIDDEAILTGVDDTDTRLLQYLDRLNLKLGDVIKLTNKEDFDGTVTVLQNHTKSLQLSELVSKSLLVRKNV